MEKLLDTHCIPGFSCFAFVPQNPNIHTEMVPGRPEKSSGPLLQGQKCRSYVLVPSLFRE